jgi:5-methylcytosine-specific restriction endonuclease McrA
MKHVDSLRGYAFEILKRDHFKCQYCGLDGTRSFDNWLALSWDHLLPKGHPDRDNPEFIVAACNFCNTADNLYFRQAEKRGLSLLGKTREDLVAQRLPFVLKTRQSYFEFWEDCVHSKNPD